MPPVVSSAAPGRCGRDRAQRLGSGGAGAKGRVSASGQRGVGSAPDPGCRVVALSVRAPAKVNLALDVGARDAAGYHAVRTVLQEISLHDRIDLALSPRLDVVADDPRIPAGPVNLAWQAADALRRAAGRPEASVRIRIRKRIPPQAGLGGGSSDAAAVLVGCNRLWGLDWPRERLRAVATGLGADVPFFLTGGTALGVGHGERVGALPPLPAWAALVTQIGPGTSTAQAYASLDALGQWPHPPLAPLLALCLDRPPLRSPAALARLAASCGNSFEAILPCPRPDVCALQDRLRAAGALCCGLCGSGAAVWALGASVAWTVRAARELRAAGLWARPVRFGSGGARVVAPAEGGGARGTGHRRAGASGVPRREVDAP